MSGTAANALELTVVEAIALGHNYVGCEHLLLGLLAEPYGAGGEVLRALGVELRAVRQRGRRHARRLPGPRATRREPRRGRASAWPSSRCSAGWTGWRSAGRLVLLLDRVGHRAARAAQPDLDLPLTRDEGDLRVVVDTVVLVFGLKPCAGVEATTSTPPGAHLASTVPPAECTE